MQLIIRFIFAGVLSLVILNAQGTVRSNTHANNHASKAIVKKTMVSKKTASKKYAAHRGKAMRAAVEPPSMGKLTGLHQTQDSLNLKSSVALVVDQDTREVLLSKNDTVVLPIASITKLMTGLLVSEAKLPLDEVVTITQDDVVGERGVRSRLQVGMQLTRGELMHLALMSSENRAAHALGRTYPGGMDVFVQLMNAKAQSLGMNSTHYVEPSGLSSDNRSSAKDLAELVAYASNNELVRQFSTSTGYQFHSGKKTINYVSTNRLTSNPSWQIDVQKTGYIAAAGRCLVMQAQIAGRKLVMVFLDSVGKNTRLGDAERVRAWVEDQHSVSKL